MAIVTRAATGGPSTRHPYVDTPEGSPAGVGITTGDTVAVRLSGNAPVEVRVVSGEAYARVGATEGTATERACTVSAGDLLYLHGTAHGTCRIELGGSGDVIEAHVYDPVELKVRLWTFSVSAQDPAGPAVGSAEPFTVYGAPLDTARLVDDVVAYWRPAGIRVNVVDARTGHLRTDRTRSIRDATHAALQADAALQKALGEARAEEVVNVVLVPVYDRLGFTYSAWGRDLYDQGEPVLKDLAGFAGPVVIVAAHGAIDPVDQTWAGRSTDVSALHGLPDPAPDADAAGFHHISLASDIAHELGHMLGLPHTPQPAQGDPSNPRLFTMLMYPRVVFDATAWQQPGWPVTQRGTMAETRTATTLATGVVAGRPTHTLRLEPVNVTLRAGTGLTLVNGWRTQSAELASEVAPGNRATDADVAPFTPAYDFPRGSAVLKQATVRKILKGGLLPAREVARARQHIADKRAFGR